MKKLAGTSSTCIWVGVSLLFLRAICPLLAEPGVYDTSSLQALERLHGHFRWFAKQKQIFCEYRGLLTRDSSKSGMVKEQTGVWRFYRSTEGDPSAFRLILTSQNEKADCNFKINGIVFPMRVAAAGLDKDEDVTEQVTKTLRCTLADFEAAIANLERIEQSRSSPLK